jgi:hypothetical protein
MKNEQEILKHLQSEEKVLTLFKSEDLRYWEIKNRIDILNWVLEASGGILVKYG